MKRLLHQIILKEIQENLDPRLLELEFFLEKEELERLLHFYLEENFVMSQIQL